MTSNLILHPNASTCLSNQLTFTTKNSRMSIEQPNSSAEQETIKLIQSSTRILAIIGAGLSRPSGLPTFRQDPWFWQSPVNEVATPVAFAKDPLRVWSVYERLRQLALTATPNRGHAALAALSQSRTESLFVTQNIGGV